jgi:excisionase family DNA binding protein
MMKDALCERLLRIDEVAESLGCSRSHVRRLRESGQLQAIDIGVAGRPCLRWMPSSLQRYLHDRKVG